MKQIFEPITLDDLYKLALNDPTIYAGLMMHRTGHPLDQALMTIIAALLYEKQALQKELSGCYAAKNIAF